MIVQNQAGKEKIVAFTRKVVERTLVFLVSLSQLLLSKEEMR